MKIAPALRAPLAALCLASVALPQAASAERLECTLLMQQIEDKLQHHGVRHYKLELVATDEVAEGKVVGSCNGGTRKVVYTRVTPAPAVKAPQRPDVQEGGAAAPRGAAALPQMAPTLPVTGSTMPVM